MEPIVSPPYESREEAQLAIQGLMHRGVPSRLIMMLDEHPVQGLNLGAGVPEEAIDAVIEQHEHDAASGGFVVAVNAGGDILNEAAAREVFGYVC